MLQSSKIILELGESKLYLRFILVIYLFSLLLVIYSSLYLLVKLGLIYVIATSLKYDWQNKKPRNKIKKIEFIDKQWILSSNNEVKQHFLEAKILIHNVLFQLIQFANNQEKKQIVLFQDQLTSNELRLLHLQIARTLEGSASSRV